MGFGDILGRRALYTPDDLAIVDAGKTPHRTFTYSELNNRATSAGELVAGWCWHPTGRPRGDSGA